MAPLVESFHRFDVVLDHSDHHYSNTDGNGNSFTYCGSTVYKKIMREWKILSKHLPDSTYVRVYNTRIDLLRAVIVGAASTPYHDGLFFFDIKFPSNYPYQPPQVHYHSHGLRLNPNLYENGKVCLSLLNTWSGKKKEMWDPNQSTILQVLVSIQGLVLNEKPFYNEPFRLRLFQEENSRRYNEDAFIKTCKTTLYLLQKPPKNFELFTADHFRQRANRILRACNAYTNSRVGVGHYRDDNENETKDDTKVKDSAISVHPVSTTFIDSMEQLYPKLVVVFRWYKASNLVEHLNLENVTTPRGAAGMLCRPYCLLLCCALVALICYFMFRA
ncbi:putative aminoacyltransferase, E1 ubiquitin-activating enzyme [Rosa chinensis]|uniref:Putative aminoacyltransferase, E1 ubiquitin-activating enzyme n=1 Tax=Rosa chinensis TaxID=74649 RepID=A0A2P6QZ53_ROSCH|nr:putative ubiquitin-conjugating enzyme E2 38 [Rosa chinensis]PRQ39467.1 putative aminoacyltransferase, E1 ubiquitin-activating enzyme [Rosa chinensis]